MYFLTNNSEHCNWCSRVWISWQIAIFVISHFLQIQCLNMISFLFPSSMTSGNIFLNYSLIYVNIIIILSKGLSCFILCNSVISTIVLYAVGIHSLAFYSLLANYAMVFALKNYMIGIIYLQFPKMCTVCFTNQNTKQNKQIKPGVIAEKFFLLSAKISTALIK